MQLYLLKKSQNKYVQSIQLKKITLTKELQRLLQTQSQDDLKNIERRTADTIVSWPNPKHWVMVHNSD